MAGMSDFSFNSYANKNAWLFSGSSTASTGFNFGDYYMIKNGTYKKLLKSYYKSEKGDTKDSTKKTEDKDLMLMKDAASSLQKSAETLKDKALWEKKEITKKDEATGEETTTTDYDWDSITKAVKSFVEDYNAAIDKAGSSDNKTVLRSASRMTGMTKSMSKVLEAVGITIGTGNKLEVDESKLKEARITTLTTLFKGSNSYADRISQRSAEIAGISMGKNRTASTYTSSGTYSDTISKLVGNKVDKEL